MHELVKSALDTLAQLSDGWNGYGAKAPKPEAIAAARRFFERAQLPDKMDTDDEGAIVLVWKGDRCRVIITIAPDGVYCSIEEEGKTMVFIDTEIKA